MLIEDLHFQAQRERIEFEIIVADDASTEIDLAILNESRAAQLPYCRHITLSSNIGRAAIRNMLAAQAQYDKLLFIDCDAKVDSPTFIHDYIATASSYCVVCGGLKHPQQIPSNDVSLRFRYEKRADKKRSAKYRNQTPYKQFTPFSFLIDRRYFMRIKFNETFTGYGYEDIYFGQELEERQATIIHIDNPLIHLGLESNQLFLEKTYNAIENLYVHRDEIYSTSRLLSRYREMRHLGMGWCITILDKILFNHIKSNLLSTDPSLLYFSLYKTILLHRIWRAR